jgi:hypothetical protein
VIEHPALRHCFGDQLRQPAVTATPRAPLNDNDTVHVDREMVDELRLNPRLHGKSRVPGQQAPRFDLNAFSRALEQRDVDYQLTRYAPDADIRIVDPNNPPGAPRTLRGAQAIQAWLLDASAREVDLHVTHLVDGGDRVAFTQCWQHEDGTEVVATSTAELQNGLITTQHTILAWHRSGA